MGCLLSLHFRLGIGKTDKIRKRHSLHVGRGGDAAKTDGLDKHAVSGSPTSSCRCGPFNMDSLNI